MHIGICRLANMDFGGATKRTMAVAEHFSQRFSVTLLTNGWSDWQQAQRFFCVDLSQVNLVYLRPLPQNFQRLRFLRWRWGRRFYQLATLHNYIRQIRKLRLDLFINSTPDMTLPPLAGRSIYMCTFPTITPNPPRDITQLSFGKRVAHQGKNWLKRVLQDTTSNNVLAEYDVITANSRFTQGWIQEKWHLPATVVYSACEMIGSTQPKAKIICHAGRFVAVKGIKNTTKRQDVLIETFKTLSELHQDGWQFHLAGGLGDDPKSQTYLQQLMSAAQDYPIFFHINASLAELHQLYQSASLYWHATGYSINAQLYPRTQEHFGMTTVEAMSAGAVPVVINSGGQAEIVSHGVNGFVWDQLAELAAYTRRLADDQTLRETMSRQAIASSQQFSKANFLARMDTIVEQLFADFTPPKYSHPAKSGQDFSSA